jgi:hypothetical protein
MAKGKFQMAQTICHWLFAICLLRLLSTVYCLLLLYEKGLSIIP